jgi:hypothetical protein
MITVEDVNKLSAEEIVENVNRNSKTINEFWLEVVAHRDKIIEDLKDRIKELSE